MCVCVCVDFWMPDMQICCRAKEYVRYLQDKLFSARLTGKVGMTILNPELPMQCLVKNKLFTIFSSLLIVAIGKVLTDCLFENILADSYP